MGSSRGVSGSGTSGPTGPPGTPGCTGGSGSGTVGASGTTGVGGFPLDECARIMLGVARGYEAASLARVVFAVFGPDAARAFEAALTA